MWDKLRQIWKTKDLRNSILFVLFCLIVSRIAAHIPIPGIDSEGLRQLFNQNQVLGLLNIFSGGGLRNFSIVMLGVGPYITASIIFQLLTMIVPSLEQLSKEPQGYQKINQWTRLLTVPLAALQGYGFITLLQRQGGGALLANFSVLEWISTILVIVAGTLFLMWLGELISERKIGNGISLMIFAGIVASVPTSLQQTFAIFDSNQIINLVVFAVIGLVTIAAIVFITEGQRNVPVHYARQIRGNRMYGGVNTHLPLKVNMAGVIPIIFAISLILFPPMIAQFFVSSGAGWLASSARFVIDLFQNQIFYGLAYFVLVVAFTFFYTYIVFHPEKIAENLQKQGGFIPGIRPGRQTMEYLQATVNKILLAGAVFLGAVAILPLVIQPLTGVTGMAIGGTSLLIVVAVVIDIVKQVNAQLTMRDYDGL